MILKLVLLLEMLAVFMGYTLFIAIKYGVQTSISQSYYVLPKNQRIFFTFFCWFFAIPAMILGENGLMFFAGGFICAVGAAAAFQEQLTYQVHMIGAIGGVILSQMAIIFVYDMLYVSYIYCLSILILSKFLKKNVTWWVEVFAFISIFFVLCLTAYGHKN